MLVVQKITVQYPSLNYEEKGAGSNGGLEIKVRAL